jgi:diguanylate cyclase (GGDEF)-like protein/PAS domain S-box-containing protein
MATNSSGQSGAYAETAFAEMTPPAPVRRRIAWPAWLDLRVVIFTIAVVLIGAIWAAVENHVRDEREDAVAGVVRQNDALAAAFEGHLNRTLKGADQLARFLRRESELRGRLLNLAAYAENGVVDTGLYRQLMVLDERGDVVVNSHAARGGENFEDREYFRLHRGSNTDELSVGKPVVGRITGRWIIPVTRRINRADGSFGGVVVLSLNPDYLLNFYGRPDHGRDGLVDIVGLDGISRARQAGDVRSFGRKMIDGALLEARAQVADGNLVSSSEREGVARYISYRTLNAYPLVVAVGSSRDALLVPLAEEAATYYKFALAANLVVALFAFLLVSLLTRHGRDADALARSEARFRATFNQAAIGISQILPDGRFLQVNQALCRMLGYTEADMLGLSHQEICHADEVADSQETRARLLDGKRVPAAVERRYRHKDGSHVWVAISTSLVRDAAGAPDYFVNMVECITERKRLQGNVEYLARHDSLTQLPNRALFYNRVQHSLEQARRRNWTTGVMFIDLDRFKVINDTLGHAVGDEVLQQVAARLADSVRSEDTVGRLGGDEFAVLLSELEHERSAGLVAQKILEALGNPFQLERHEVFLTASIGIAISAPDGCDADTLISNADAAVYDAKCQGRNNFQFYTATMSERAMEKLLLEKELRFAVERNELLLNFQPKVNLESGEITGFEALLRWHRTGGEIVSPAVFIPVLEECRLIEEVGEWVLRTACAQINQWQAAGLQPVPVAVNLSPKQFRHQDIVGMIARALADNAVDPALLEMEITEGAAMNKGEGAIAVLQKIKALGVRIAIDDFGTGYSSLSYLTRFPIDSLKIDRSFVVDLPDSREGASIARAVITMAQSLHLKVIAEGVETAAQIEFLAENGCDEIQGYYCSRPLSAEAATELLRSRRLLLARPQQLSVAAA